ncbi:MAG TPA: nuclear transport factor 2 family protein [Ramlibacter sp.]|uniref:nuclear transport factor 2 family protein n=1 Tax=Ramlibacter sp. TaxID=1917967 RepID=UPI002C90B734|nr:nuclear transport factor 2 family protein [Ramlibacter sp.]HVZ45503.1 nuclear transport factor 2 family protein [Ramlibacter sp.]
MNSAGAADTITLSEESIKARENQRRAATVAGDFPRLEGLLDDRLHYRHANGVLEDKRAYLANFREVTYHKFVATHEAVTVAGDAAIVSLTEIVALTIKDGSHQSVVVHALDVWSKNPDGVWRLLARQALYQK